LSDQSGFGKRLPYITYPANEELLRIATAREAREENVVDVARRLFGRSTA
jgi:hypothetical protein